MYYIIIFIFQFFFKQYNNLDHIDCELNSTSNVTIDIFFVRRRIKFLIEKWSFNYIINDKNKKIRKILLLKKIGCFIRTLYGYTKILPAYNLYINNVSDYHLQYKINGDNNSDNDSDNKLFNEKKKVSSNCCDFGVGKINFRVEYINKIDIFAIEDKFVII
jgi:hypothetical protein